MNEQELELETNKLSLAELKQRAQDAELAAQEPEPETIFQRTVKDPDGVERIYQGDSQESLLDAVVEGRAVHQPQPVEIKPKELTADEEFCLAQEFATSPSKAFKKMAAETFGVPIADVKSRLQKLAEYEQNESAQVYVDSHPDFYPTPKNGKAVTDAMKAANLPITVANIAATVELLEKQGALIHRPEPIDPYGIDLETLKNLANNTEIHTPEAGDGWDF
jgi:hypothetical protein